MRTRFTCLELFCTENVSAYKRPGLTPSNSILAGNTETPLGGGGTKGEAGPLADADFLLLVVMVALGDSSSEDETEIPSSVSMVILFWL